uniref:Phosphonoacetaldehyde hydrolase n=1 Tax=Talaromyces marneffei PM1 TaxID=1077442 RepID=A0A093X6J6_TALMA
MVSESPPGPEAGKGLAPVLEGLAPAAKGLVTSLSKFPRNIAKPQAAPPKQAPKNWASTAGTAQQGNDGDWKTVQYNKKRGINNASDTVRRDTRDILLRLNRALDSAGLPIFMRAVDAGYAASGHLTVLMKDGTPSKVLVPAYNDMLLTAIRRADPAVISVEGFGIVVPNPPQSLESLETREEPTLTAALEAALEAGAGIAYLQEPLVDMPTRPYKTELSRDGIRGEKVPSTSIINLTISNQALGLLDSWEIETDGLTTSDHLVIWASWECPEDIEDSPQEATITGWQIGALTEDKKALEAAISTLGELMSAQPSLTDDCSLRDVEREAEWIEQSLTDVLRRYAKPIRLCARSKRWWGPHTIEARRLY